MPLQSSPTKIEAERSITNMQNELTRARPIPISPYSSRLKTQSLFLLFERGSRLPPGLGDDFLLGLGRLPPRLGGDFLLGLEGLSPPGLDGESLFGLEGRSPPWADDPVPDDSACGAGSGDGVRGSKLYCIFTSVPVSPASK